MPQKILILLSLLMSSPVFSLTIQDVLNRPEELKEAGCSEIAEARSTSVQASLLFESYATYRGMIPEPERKIARGVLCGNVRGVIYYYQYQNASDRDRASNFIRPLIWGGDHPTPMHPERIMTASNLLVIISMQGNASITEAVNDRLFYRDYLPETLTALSARFHCTGKEEVNSPCGVIAGFAGGAVLREETPYSFGQSWEVSATGQVTREFYEVIRIRKSESTLTAQWLPVTPDDDSEKAMLESLLQAGKQGKPAQIPGPLLAFLDSNAGRNRIETRFIGNSLMLLKEGNIAFVRRSGNCIFLIVTMEHWTGLPSTCILAYFWTH